MRWPRRTSEAAPVGSEPQWTALTYAPNQPVAEMICNMLQESGLAAYHRRAQGFDVPDFMASGPRIVMVHRTTLENARAVIEPLDIDDAPG